MGYNVLSIREMKQVRGPGDCMVGASWDAFYGVCVENVPLSGSRRANGGDPQQRHFAYGPFDPSLVSLCLQKGGGLMCYGLRWQADFYFFLMDTHNGARPIHCDQDVDGLFNCDGTQIYFTFALLPFPFLELFFLPNR